MQNMQVILYPKEIHISTPSTISLRLTYKKMTISTNHELEKYQNRESYPIKNSIAVINDQIKFKLSKQFQLNNTKIVIVVIGIKGRDVSCIGDVTLDLAALSKKQGDSFKVKIDKCRDVKAYIVLQVKFLQKPVDINEFKKSRKQKQPQKLSQLGILKTDHYYKQQLYISRRQKQDKPTAYQISRKNYVYLQEQQKKANEITRSNNNTINITSTSIKKNLSSSISKSKQKRLSNESIKQIGVNNNNNGSYKKRFMYDVRRQEGKSRERSMVKQTGNNYMKGYRKQSLKDKSPSPRTKTPQPITLQTLKSKQQSYNSRVSPLDLSSMVDNKNDSDIIQPDTFRALPQPNSQFHSYTQQYSIITNNHHLHRQQQTISHSKLSVSSIQSINNQKDSKYKMITEKLEMIQSKIREQKEKGGDTNGEVVGDKGRDSKVVEVEAGVREEGKRYSPNTQRVGVSKQIRITPFQSPQIVQQKKSLSPISPSDSSCPRTNQRAPSPINQQSVQTPQYTKKHIQSLRMSEFTINSRRNNQDIQMLQQKQSPNEQQLIISQSQMTGARTLESSTIRVEQQQQQQQLHQRQQQQPPLPRTSPSGRVPSRQKREISPTGLSFQRRQSQLKLQKKSSLGRNYIQTQVKMLQLEIQQKDMKYQRLEKKYTKKQEQYGRLIIHNEELQKKIMELGQQVIQSRSRVLQLEREAQQMEIMGDRLRERELEIERQKRQIQQLNSQLHNITTLSVYKQQKPIPTIDENSQTDQDIPNLIQSYQHCIQQHQNNISSLNQQLQIYLNEITCLRQRNQQFLQLKSKYDDLNIKYQRNLSLLEDMKRQKDTQVYNNKIQQQSQIKLSEESSLQHSRANNLSPSQSVRSAHQLLQQTIQKQSLLQQSLKSLENQNKSLSQQIRTLQQDKSILIQKNTLSQTQIKTLKEQLQSLQSSIRTKQTQFQLKIRQLENERDLISQKLTKKQKTIQKLSGINQSLNSKIFKLEQEKNNKIDEHSEETDILVMKNAENEQLISELKEKLVVREKQVNTLKQILRDRQQEQSKQTHLIKAQPLIRRQPSSSSSQNSQRAHNPTRISTTFRASKSDDLIKTKVVQQVKQGFYQKYLNQKAKATNIQAQLRYAQNDIRNLKMKIDLLTHEKKDLQQQIDMIAYNNERDLAKKGLEHKLSMQNNSISESVKLQNKALKQQITLLQSQVEDLNVLLDSAIQRTNNFEASQIASILSNPEVQKNIMNEKYLAMARRLQAYQTQLRSKKNKMAEIINAIWRGGNAALIDQIDKIMGADE